MITCVSAVLGEYDHIKITPPGADAYVIFVGDEKQASDARRLGWEPRIRRNSALDARYLSKAPKCAPHLLGIFGDVLWIDGSLRSTGRDVVELVKSVPLNRIGAFKHRWNDHIRDEATASLAIKRYEGQPIAEQARHYYQNAFAGNFSRIWETGVLVHRWQVPESVGDRWLAEQLAWSNQDQISFPLFEDWIHDLSPGNVISNPWFEYVNHKVEDWR